jgi:adenosylmethionine-8-amino-7-oxononanoate aminotransferase
MMDTFGSSSTNKTSVTTQTVLDADTRYTWHPYTQHQGRIPPLEIVRTEGAYLYTRDGRKIFDAVSSWWVTTHGHAQTEIAEAIAHQAKTLEHVIFTNFTHEPAALFAQELVEVLPEGLTRVFFSDDGSTAVEAGVKMALQYHANRGKPKKLIAAFEHAYHGDTFGAMSVSARGLFTAPFDSHLFHVHHLPAPIEGDTLQAFDRLVERHGGDLAAIIVEPLLMGTAGMLMYDAALLRSLRERARAHDVVFIADEVLTGFGRTGPLFACERAGISPDIMCLSKGITGGFLPLGATVATEQIFESFLSDDRRRTLFHGHSYTANPIACAAARASLRLFTEDSEQQRTRIEQTHRAHLDRLRNLPLVKNPRVLGTVAAFDIDVDAGYLNPIGLELASFALQHDILLRPLGNVVYVLPPYCATDEDLTHVYSVIERFLTSK